ncbi:MAG: sugar phosphate isomerase/epimerase, partial [Clostridia bacterium]|nr:sugar phosphate isomerase/epimerase [Clostridia bacterium]
MNKFGICITGNVPESVEENIKAMAEAGFKYTFIGWKEELDLGERIALFNKYGITVDNFHAPFGGINCIWNECTEGSDYVDRLKKCIDDAAKYGVKYVVMHPTAGAPEPHTSPVGIERFRSLAQYATERGVKVCFENLEYPEVLGIVMHELADLDIGFCYDVGHEAQCTPGMQFLPMFGDKLCCTHIHDNYGMSHSTVAIIHGDCHMLPFDASIDFNRVMHQIRDTGYDGVLMIEASIRDDLGTYMGMTAREYY